MNASHETDCLCLLLVIARKDYEMENALFVKGASYSPVLALSAQSRMLALEQKVAGLPHERWF